MKYAKILKNGLNRVALSITSILWLCLFIHLVKVAVEVAAEVLVYLEK